MKKGILIICMLPTALWLAGCGGHRTVDLFGSYLTAGEEQPPAMGSAASIRVGPKLAALVDGYDARGNGSVEVNTGAFAAAVFSGGPDAEWELELVRSELWFTLKDEFPLPLAYAYSRYELSCVLRKGGESHALVGRSEHEMVVTVKGAVELAVKNALQDIRAQAAALQ